MKKVWTLLLVCGLVLSLAAVGFAAAKEKPKYGGVWKDALQNNPPYLDPVMSTDVTSSEVIYQMFETLVENDNDGGLKPLLAQSWKASKDAMTFTFTLRKGVHFHASTEGGKPTANGGREVTAQDWVWTFNYICSPKTNSPRAYFMDMLKGYKEFQSGKADSLAGVKAIDKYTLQFTLSQPYSPFVSVLAYNTFVVLPKEDVQKWGENWNFHPVGTGPFKFESWAQDNKIVLSKNENYWLKDEFGGKMPYLDKIEFRIIEDFGVMWEEFKAGNLYQTEVDDPYYQEARTKYKNSFIERPDLSIYYFGMNMQKGIFAKNKNLRQALNYAVDREALNKMVLNGREFPAKGVLPPGMMGYNPKLKGYNFDPAKAKELMKKAGYPNGFSVTLQYNTNTRHRRVAEALQAMLSQYGVKITLKNVEWATHLDTTARGDVEFFRMGWTCDYNDPDNFLYVLFNSANIGEQGNYTHYRNPSVDMLTLKARTETNPAVRKQLYQQAEQIIVDDAPMLFLLHQSTHSLVQPFVKGYELPAFGQYANKFFNVWLDK